MTADYDETILPSKRIMEAMEIDRQLHLRETAVRSAELKLVKMTLDQCALTEGVNALENCDGLVRQYLRMMKTHKAQDWRQFHRAKYFVVPASDRVQPLKNVPEDLTAGERLYLGQEGIDALNERRRTEAGTV